MGREFELRREVELPATPEQVWEAVATGPGLASWFMGPYEIDPGAGGTVRLAVEGYEETSAITAWDPPHRYTAEGEKGADGSFHAFEYIVEGRGEGTTVFRFVHSGFIGGDWGDEYVAQTGRGWDMYLHNLREYLTHFPGRTAAYVMAQGPAAPDAATAWERVRTALGAPPSARAGDRVRLTPEGLPAIDGVVDYAVEGFDTFLAVRTGDGLYRFMGGGPAVAVGHHVFAPGTDAARESAAWGRWLAAAG
jgi:uncharacterized protein YndB with AHSA1/START domain